MWGVITQISSPLAAVTFIAAVFAVFGYRTYRIKLRLIQSAPPEARAQLVDKALETYHIVNDDLAPTQKYKLMLAVLNLRVKRMKLIAISMIGIFFIAVAGIIAIWIIEKGGGNNVAPELIQELIIRK